ncbi:GNAT family N-acetyltransferase [Paenibacillus ginsengarvi]|uniref:GNAT family N-acetyltransferase n=1 Tax=Paenibacillus ginsengarvi TaxID=400777 RepID=A0A3B0AX46_9BACL|nr:GNAT family N-acetyltransferase [Paenibacillus ginsengarvi]RKN64899.1 GNAT family N-acetyltransferase [Paenibacillus ginsengarvi]
MPFIIRSYTDGDRERVIQLSQSVYAGKTGSFSLVEQIDGKRILAKVVAADAETGHIAGYALLSEQVAPMIRLRLELNMEEPYTEAALAHELYDNIEQEVGRLAPYAVEARVFASDPIAIRFFEQKGFVCNHRMEQQKLYVPEANIEPFAHTEKELQRDGIWIGTLSEERALRPDCTEELERLVLETYPDFPNELPTRFRTPNTDASWLHRTDLLAEAFFIARHGTRYVGYSQLEPGPEGSSLAQGYTAVSQAYTKRGIATALKIRGIQFAARQGCDTIYTSNRSNNGPMGRVNAKLGWRVFESEMRMQRIVSSGCDSE